MKTLILLAVVASFCVVNITADPEPEADPGYVSRRRPIYHPRPIYRNPYNYRWKRSADPEPEAAALANAEPNAEASHFYGRYNNYHGARFPGHFNIRPYNRRWRRSAEPEPEPEADAHSIFGYRRRFPSYGSYGYRGSSYYGW